MSPRNIRMPLCATPLTRQVSANLGSWVFVCSQETWMSLQHISHCRHPSLSNTAGDTAADMGCWTRCTHIQGEMAFPEPSYWASTGTWVYSAHVFLRAHTRQKPHLYICVSVCMQQLRTKHFCCFMKRFSQMQTHHMPCWYLGCLGWCQSILTCAMLL